MGFFFFPSLAERAITAVPVTALPLEAIVTSSDVKKKWEDKKHYMGGPRYERPFFPSFPALKMDPS